MRCQLLLSLGELTHQAKVAGQHRLWISFFVESKYSSRAVFELTSHMHLLQPRSKGENGVCIQCPDGSIPSSSCGHGPVQLQGTYCHGVKISWPMMLLSAGAPFLAEPALAGTTLRLRSSSSFLSQSQGEQQPLGGQMATVRRSTAVLLVLALVTLAIVGAGVARRLAANQHGGLPRELAVSLSAGLLQHPDKWESVRSAATTKPSGSAASSYHRIIS